MSDSAPGERSAGALLKAARERQGLHIAALAAAIKVTPRKLEALEGDRWSELPDSTFARALAQTVCRTLKIDSRPVLDLLPPAGGVGFQSAGGGLNAPFREKSGREESGLGLAGLKPSLWVWAAVLLMLAAVAVYFAPATWWSGKSFASLSTAVLGAASAPGVAVPATTTTTTTVLTPAVTAPAAATPASSSASLAPPPAPAASGVVGETVFSAPQQPQADATPPAGAVQLRVSEASWMDVRDARGQILLSRMVQPGESVGLDGTPPMRLTIGNASATTLGYRGQPVDLAKFSTGNVARLELR